MPFSIRSKPALVIAAVAGGSAVLLGLGIWYSTTGSSLEANTDPTQELRAVIIEMITDSGAKLSPEETAELAERRLREGVESIQRFYPEFLDGSAPAVTDAAQSKELVIGLTTLFSGYRGGHLTPIETWLVNKQREGELTPIWTQVLLEILRGTWQQLAAKNGYWFSPRRNTEMRQLHLALFPGSADVDYDDESARQVEQLRSQLSDIIRGMHEFHDKYRALPGPDRKSYNQPRGLSWRVHLLPFLGLTNIHKQFNLDEPWDSAHNLKLVARMPDVFKTVGDLEPGMTSIHVFVGPQTPFGERLPPRFGGIPDGTYVTLCCVAAGPEKAEEWTRPGGIQFDSEEGVSQLGTPQFEIGFLGSFMSGTVEIIPLETPTKKFTAMVGHNDGITDGIMIARNGIVDSPRRWPFGRLVSPMGPRDKMASIGAALHNYYNSYLQFPGKTGGDDDRPTELSWRVHLLPYLEEARLFKQFKLDEPWDSPHNIKLVDALPEVFRLAGVEKNKTVLHLFVGENTPFDGEKPRRYYRDLMRGGSNTIMLVMGAPQTATEWTKPGGLTFNPATPLGNFTRVDDGHPVVMFDRSVKLLSPQATAKELADLINHRDGSVVNPSLLKPWN